jgi:flagellar biosynthetic protein FlhB
VAGEKTEKATPKRKKDERKKGNIFLSQEIVTIFTLMATFYCLKLMMPWIMSALEKSIKQFIDEASVLTTLTIGRLGSLFVSLLIVFAETALIHCLFVLWSLPL